MYSNYRSVEHFSDPNGRTVEYSYYKGPPDHRTIYNTEHFEQQTHKSVDSHNDNHKKCSYLETSSTVALNNHKVKPQPIQMKWENKHYGNLSDPRAWGPAFWFTLHNGASKYPLSASNITKERMKGYIIGIPVMIPCAVCQIHACNFIDQHKSNLDDICSGRDKLFAFFVKFHNKVNQRYNKPEMSVEDAYKLYSEGININTMSYSNN